MWTRSRLLVILAAAAITVSGTAIVLVVTSTPASGLVPFFTYGDLSSYLDHARSAPSGGMYFGGNRGAMSPIAGPAYGNAQGPSAPAYSSTNVQVAGVDELDMVKTDGTHIFIASQGEVDILLAYPATEMRVVARILLQNLTSPLTGNNYSQAMGLFVNGSHLVVVASGTGYPYGEPVPPPMMGAPAAGFAASYPLVWTGWTFVFLFDVSDAAHPVLLHSLAVTGSPAGGRMVGPTVYILANQWIEEVNGTYLLPQICADGVCRQQVAGSIYHDPQSEDAWDYTNILALDVGTASSRVTSFITGGYSTLYMSATAIYLAFFKWEISQASAGFLAMPVRLGSSWTTIYKLTAEGLDILPVASANVAGSILNQYSMDEWNGNLRVATTVRNFSSNGSTITNGVYIFDGSLNLLGSVEGLAGGESIFAVRFMGDRAYMVTFQKIDPLFVLDLSDPAHPVVTGDLNMPGFSEYLYPLDTGHLLGVGKDAIPAIEGNWSWYQGLKLSLYDVTNATSPTETANVTLGDRGSQSEVLQDPHAFLYIPDRQLVVLPVDLAVIDPSQYSGGVPDWAWGTIVWEGAYVYRVNATTGFQLVGRVAHGNGTLNQTYGWYNSPTQIRRSLYIGDVLYTISGTEVLASSLADLSEIASVVYASSPACPYCGPVVSA